MLLAFLHADFVLRLGWLSEHQLVEAVAIGQLTPGPVFTTATFIGFILKVMPGAMLATLGIFLPSFIFVAISASYVAKLRNSHGFSSLLDGVNSASLGLLAAVYWQLGKASLVDVFSSLIFIVALILLLRFKVNTTWLIIGGALAGMLSSLLK